MPGMNGLEVAEARPTQLQEPDVRVLFMSGYTDPDVARRGVRKLGWGLLMKPFTAAILTSRVRAGSTARLTPTDSE